MVSVFLTCLLNLDFFQFKSITLCLQSCSLSKKNSSYLASFLSHAIFTSLELIIPFSYHSHHQLFPQVLVLTRRTLPLVLSVFRRVWQRNTLQGGGVRSVPARHLQGHAGHRV